MKKEELLEFIKQTNKEDFENYYRTHTNPDVCSFYKLSSKNMTEVLTAFGISYKTAEEIEKIRNANNLAKYGVENPSQRQEIKEKKKQSILEHYGDWDTYVEEKQKKTAETCIKKYGVRVASQSTEIQEKMKQTNLEKYGVDNYFKASDFQDKNKATRLEKYGDENYVNLEKMKQTKLEKYGDENYANIEKAKRTNLERYGYEQASKNEKIKQSIIKSLNKTCQEKYNVDFPLQAQEVKEKAIQGCVDKYGVEYCFQRDDFKKKWKDTMFRRYRTTSPINADGAKEKSEQTRLERYGVRYNCLRPEAQKRYTISKTNKKFGDIFGLSKDCYEFVIDDRSYDFKVNNDTLLEINPSVTHNSTFPVFKKGSKIKPRTYHRDKMLLAENNGYRCICLWDWDMDKIDILKSMISEQKKKYYARQLQIKEIKDIDVVSDFLNNNHLQGFCKGNEICLGLFNNDELIELMTFGKPRYNKNYEYELLRLCTKIDSLVVGGSEKLWKYFVEKYNPSSVISYCDRSKFSGKIYTSLGFTFLRSQIGLHWYNIKTKQHITNSLLTQRGFDKLFGTSYGKGTSNEQLMLDNGFVKVYDCGQDTFIWENK